MKRENKERERERERERKEREDERNSGKRIYQEQPVTQKFRQSPARR